MKSIKIALSSALLAVVFSSSAVAQQSDCVLDLQAAKQEIRDARKAQITERRDSRKAFNTSAKDCRAETKGLKGKAKRDAVKACRDGATKGNSETKGNPFADLQAQNKAAIEAFLACKGVDADEADEVIETVEEMVEEAEAEAEAAAE